LEGLEGAFGESALGVSTLGVSTLCSAGDSTFGSVFAGGEAGVTGGGLGVLMEDSLLAIIEKYS
jgi:hypothetical protein